MNRSNLYAKIGGTLYVLWGIIHILGGLSLLVTVKSEGLNAFFAQIASASPLETPVQDSKVISSVAASHSFNLFWMGLMCCIVAIEGNFKNKRYAYWVNMGLAGFADIGLIVFSLAPGHLSLAEGLTGPTLWILAALFTTLALKQKQLQQ
jgi:hypothetical protein